MIEGRKTMNAGPGVKDVKQNIVGLPFSRLRVSSYALAVIFILSVGIYFRLYPLFHQTTNDLYDKATLSVIAQIRKSADFKATQITGIKNPTETRQLSKLLFDKFLRDENERVRENIDKRYQAILHANPTIRPVPYLLEADPYNYFGLTQNIKRTGRISEQIKGSKYFNEKMLAPLGHWEPLTLHPYVGYLTYRVLKIFNHDIPLMLAVGYVPLLLTVLAALVYLRLSLYIGSSMFSAMTGVYLLVLSPIFAKRSAMGWYDNDPYNILFGFLVLYVYLTALNQKDLKSTLFRAIACAILIVIYAFFWQGWMYLLCVLMLSTVLVWGYRRLIERRRDQTKPLGILFIVMAGGTLVFMSLTFGFHDFFVLFKEGWNAFKNFLEPRLDLWPDVYLGVGELHKISLIKLAGELGYVLCGLAATGFLFRTVQIARKNIPEDVRTSFIVISLFGVIAVSMALGARRFSLISLIPASLLATGGMECLWRAYERTGIFLQKKSRCPPAIGRGIFIVIFSLLMFFPLHSLDKEMYAWRPIYNDVWNKAMNEIREKTPPDSIINTWWPPGHFITAMAERRVTFSGATINVPQAYWLANVFLAENEMEALGILRMLNNSANRPMEFLEERGLKVSQAVELIKEICPLPPGQARKKLLERFNEEQTEKILSMTHAEPPSSYLLIYNEMAEQNIEYSFLGRWNFSKVEQIESDRTLSAAVPRKNSQEYIRFLWKLVGGPLRNSENLVELGRQEGGILFEKGVFVNLTEHTCLINSSQFGKGIPEHLIYFDGQKLSESKPSNPTLKISVLVRHDNGRYTCQIIDYTLAKSLLFRLFYFNGDGLKYFIPFLHERDLTGRTEILVYKVDWKKLFQDLKE